MRNDAKRIPRYVEINGHYVALIGKVASSTIARHAAALGSYPFKVNGKLLADDPAVGERTYWHTKVRDTRDKVDRAVVLVRHPAERFASACRHVGSTPEQITERDLAEDYHFVPQRSYLAKESILFKYPEHLPQFFTYVGIREDVKPSKTHELPAGFSLPSLYDEDVKIYDSIQTPETVWHYD